MWYKEDPSGYKREELLTLYRILDNRERAFRDDLFRFTNFYAAVCYAILGVTLSGFVSLYGKVSGSILLCLVFGPLLTLCMCFLGMRVTGRIYRRVVEEISTKAKLENIMGLDAPLSIVKYEGKGPIWTEDTCILNTRHAKRRLTENESQKFVDASAKHGFYRDNRVYFGLIGLFSVFLLVAIVVFGIFASMPVKGS